MKLSVRDLANSLRPGANLVGKVLPMLTLFSNACSSSATEASPRLDEAPSRPEDMELDPEQAIDTPEAQAHTIAELLLSCVDDEVRVCTYYLPEHNGVQSCVIGYQVCSDNQWGQCLGGGPVDGGSAAGTGGSY